MDLELRHEKDRIYAEDAEGKLLAEVCFPPDGEGRVNICHTFVDESLRGQGVAGRLLQEAASDIAARGLKAKATCSYAARWFAEHPEHAALLEERP